jgi:hypothetical protein
VQIAHCTLETASGQTYQYLKSHGVCCQTCISRTPGGRMQCTCSWASKFSLNKTKQYLCIMAPAPLLHSFTEGNIDEIGSSNTIEANLLISPRAAASIQAYQDTVSAKSTFYLPPDYAPITIPTHRHTRVYPPRSTKHKRRCQYCHPKRHHHPTAHRCQ